MVHADGQLHNYEWEMKSDNDGESHNVWESQLRNDGESYNGQGRMVRNDGGRDTAHVEAFTGVFTGEFAESRLLPLSGLSGSASLSWKNFWPSGIRFSFVVSS